MKHTKIISFVVALLTVVGLGIFMGKSMFKLIEPPETQRNNQTQKITLATDTASIEPEHGTVKILYSDKKDFNSDLNDKKQQISTNQSSAKPISNNIVSNSTNSSSTTNSEKSTPNTIKPNTPSNETLMFNPNGPRWYAYSSTNGLNVRESPDIKGKFMFKVKKGTRGVVKEKKDGWTYIQWDFNKKKGWSSDEYLVQGPANIVENIVNNKTSDNKLESVNKEKLTQASIEKELEQSKTIIGVARPASLTETVITYTNGKDLPKRGTITPQGGANIRESPSTQSARLIKLPKDTVVGIKSVKQVDKYQWFEITFSNGSRTGWTREDNLKF